MSVCQMHTQLNKQLNKSNAAVSNKDLEEYREAIKSYLSGVSREHFN